MPQTMTEAARLHQRMVERLIEQGMIQSDDVERAFRKVPRHLFLSGITDEFEAYQDQVVELIPNVSTASQPSVVAMMLEELGVEAGDSVLEIGTASGYNAALLSELTGDANKVFTVELERRLSESARDSLRAAGYEGVHVAHGDGMKGFPQGAPFDRIIITAASSGLSSQLASQLAGGGVLLMPWSVAGLPEVVLRLVAAADQTRPSLAGEIVGFPVTFVPIRGGRDANADKSEGARIVSEVLGLSRERAWVEGWSFDVRSQIAFGLYIASALPRVGPDNPETLLGLALDNWCRDARPTLADLSVSATEVGVPSPHVERIRGIDYHFSFGPVSRS